MASTGQTMILSWTSLSPFPPLALRTAVTKVRINESSEEGYQAWSLDTAVGNLLAA